MKHRFFGIFGKVFFYTLLILIVILLVLFFFFSDQLKGVVESTQQQQISDIFHPLLSSVDGKSEAELIKTAKEYHAKNTAFEFCFEAADGRILYQTENFKLPQDILPQNDVGDPSSGVIVKGRFQSRAQFRLFTNKPLERIQFVTQVSGGVKLYVSGILSGATIYDEFIGKVLIAFALILLTSILAAAVFARRIAKPIQSIAADTKKMSNLETVPPPRPREDEIGQLAGDVYKMYQSLQVTIEQLETEIAREKEMEENQRYFFAAASHELKTPIAAASALLEGMLENVVEPSEYPGCLRECMKVMNEQNKLVSEILEIVSLSNHTITIEQERVNLNTWVADVLAPCKIIADAKSQVIYTDIPDEIFCTLSPKLLGRAFSNILMNAIQNTPDGGEIHIFTQKKEQRVRLYVLNKGVKIEDALLSKLFEPFYHGDKARSRGKGRNGLGLTIVKKTLDLLKIPYALQNTEGGVLFRMDLALSE